MTLQLGQSSQELLEQLLRLLFWVFYSFAYVSAAAFDYAGRALKGQQTVPLLEEVPQEASKVQRRRMAMRMWW
jgi:hypothetical protein